MDASVRFYVDLNLFRAANDQGKIRLYETCRLLKILAPSNLAHPSLFCTSPDFLGLEDMSPYILDLNTSPRRNCYRPVKVWIVANLASRWTRSPMAARTSNLPKILAPNPAYHCNVIWDEDSKGKLGALPPAGLLGMRNIRRTPIGEKLLQQELFLVLTVLVLCFPRTSFSTCSQDSCWGVLGTPFSWFLGRPTSRGVEEREAKT